MRVSLFVIVCACSSSSTLPATTGTPVPPACDDGNACTNDVLQAGRCESTQLTNCASGDGCCGAGCSADEDTECQSVTLGPFVADGYSHGIALYVVSDGTTSVDLVVDRLHVDAL